MPTKRDVKRKITGVQSTQQITRAMKLMSTAKLRRAREQYTAMRFYLERLDRMVKILTDAVDSEKWRQIAPTRPEIHNYGIILVAGERGLCGSFNHDICKTALRELNARAEKPCRLFIIGQKGYDYFKRLALKFVQIEFFPDIGSECNPEKIHIASNNFLSCYQHAIIDELILIYTGPISTLQHQIFVKKILPFDIESKVEINPHLQFVNFDFDPSPEIILGSLIPRYIEGTIYRAILESSFAEQSARMLAMTAATDRAEEMISDLTVLYNRIRQASVTTELLEVVSGADAQAD